MKRKLILLIVAALIVAIPLAADEYEDFPSEEEIIKALEVVSDCFSTSVAVTYSDSDINLPSCYVSMNEETQLPSRIAFFLANPYEFQLILKSEMGPQKSILSTLLSLIHNQEKDPLLSTAYLNLSSKDYQEKAYFLSGYLNISYPKDTTFENLAQFILSREYSEDCITLEINLNVLKISDPALTIRVEGNFEMYVKEDGTIDVSSLDSYTINGKEFESGNYTF